MDSGTIGFLIGLVLMLAIAPFAMRRFNAGMRTKGPKRGDRL